MLSNDFIIGSNLYEKIILKCIVISIALARPQYHFVNCKENNYKTCKWNTLLGSFGPLVSVADFTSPKKYVTFVEDHLMNIPTKLVSNWPSGFREKDKNVQVRDYDGHKVMVIYVPTVTLRVR